MLILLCFFFFLLLQALASLGKLCIAAVQAYDTSTESIDALNAAEMKLQDIINSPSLDAACRKIDSLAEKNQLDSALVLMITKAWSAAKESNMMKDEVPNEWFYIFHRMKSSLSQSGNCFLTGKRHIVSFVRYGQRESAEAYA